MGVERVDIEIREDGSRVVKRDLDALGESAANAAPKIDRLTSSVTEMRNVLRTLAGLFFLRELAEFTDLWIQYKNNIDLSTSSVQESVTVQKELYEASQRARVDIEASMIVYRRTAQAAKELGTSQQEMITFTEGVSKALAIQGIGIKQAHGALLQLGQLIGMARIRAQEFNSINENAPRILQAVADNLDKAGGSIHKLRLALQAGLISNKEFYDAFLKAIPKLEAEFAKIMPTFSQAFVVLKNGFGHWLDNMNKGTGYSQILTSAIIWLGKNFDLAAKAVGVLGVTLLVAFAPSIILQIRAMTVAIFGMASALGPIGLLLTTIAALGSAFILYRNDIKLTADGAVTLGDVFTATWGEIKSGAETVASALGDVWKSLRPADGGKGAMDSFKNMLISMLQAVAIWVDVTIGQFVAFYRALGVVVEGYGKIIASGLKDAVMMAVDPGKWIYEALTGKGSNLKQALSDLSKDVKEALGSSVGDSFVDSFIAKIKAASTARRAEEAAANLTKRAGGGYEAGEDLIKLARALQQVTDKANPMKMALDQMTKANDVLWRSARNGLITWDEFAYYIKMVQEHYEAALNPLAAMNSKIQEEIYFMTMEHDARSAGLALMNVEKTLRREGYILTEAQRAKYYELFLAMDQEKRIVDETERIYRKFYGAQRQLAEGSVALSRLLKQGKISLAEWRDEFAHLAIEAGKGTWADGFIVQLGVLDKKISNFTARAGEAFGNLVDGIESGLGRAISRAIVFGESLKDALGNVGREVLAQLLEALIKIGLQFALNAMIGASLASLVVAASTAQAGVLAAAWAPAAAMASLATLGENSIPAGAALSGTIALAESLTALTPVTESITAPQMFSQGGFTGYGGRNEIAGFVHGQEFVMNAEATARNRAILEAMNRGQSVSQPLNISVHNYSTAGITVQRLSPTDVRIIAREEAHQAVFEKAPMAVASDIANPNSRVSQALNRNTNTQRKRV